ncbi:unnamed protein product, partial [Notodromas monacha]
MKKGTKMEPSSIRTANTQTNRYCPNLTTSVTETDLSPDTLSSVEECEGCALSRNFVQFMKTKRLDVDAREVISIETAKSTAEDCARCKLVMNLIINLLRFCRDDIVLFNLVMATQYAIKNQVQILASADLGESNVAINEEKAGPAPCQLRRVIPSRMSKKRTHSSSSSRKYNSNSASMSECDEGMTNASKKKSVRCAKERSKKGEEASSYQHYYTIRQEEEQQCHEPAQTPDRVFNRGEQQMSRHDESPDFSFLTLDDYRCFIRAFRERVRGPDAESLSRVDLVKRWRRPVQARIIRILKEKFVSRTTALLLAKHVPFRILKKLNLNLYTSKYFLRSSALSALYTGPHAECSKNAESIEEISMPTTSENSSASGICPDNIIAISVNGNTDTMKHFKACVKNVEEMVWGRKWNHLESEYCGFRKTRSGIVSQDASEEDFELIPILISITILDGGAYWQRYLEGAQAG